ncbi:MAG: hypothetical protein SNG34_02005 [Rikenellaceae bacterium]
MKKITSAFLTMLVLFSSFAMSCTKDDTSSTGSVSIGLTVAAATSATFSINASSATEFAYKVYSSGESAATNGLVIFADADEQVTIDDSSFNYTVYGLEGSSSYTIAFAFKMANGNYTVESVDVTTVDYSDEKMIYIIAAERNYVKFYLNMPEGTKYRYALVDRSSYELYKLEYSYYDLDYLETGTKGEGPLTVQINDNNITGYDDDGVAEYQYVKPGMSFVLMVIECDDSYNPLCEIDYSYSSSSTTSGVSTRVEEPNIEVYSEVCADDAFTMNGLYAKQTFTTRQPLPADGDVAISISTTELTATVSISPSAEVLRIGYAIWETAMLEYLESLVGADGLVAAALDDLESATSAVEYEESISLDVAYTLMVIYISDEEEMTRSVKLVEFTATESELDAVEIEISAVDSDNPYEVWFNIKAPNKDCTRLAYIMDYSRTFYPEAYAVGGDTTADNITYLILTYGNELTEALYKTIFDAINSDSGYDMYFDSNEDTKSTLAILTYNEDEKTYLAYCDSMSAVEPALDPLTTDFFDTIDGYWTAAYNYIDGYNVDDESNYGCDEFTMIITDDPLFDAPTTFDSSHEDYAQLYNYYIGRGTSTGESDPSTYAKTQIQTDFEYFLEVGAHFQEKYQDQNRKVIFGFGLSDANTLMVNHSPWTLFCDLDHSTYDVEQLFYDYGPKIFIEVVNDSGENVIQINNDYDVVDPFFSYYGSEFGFAGMSSTAWMSFPDYYDEAAGIFASGYGLPITCEGDTIEIGCYEDSYGNADYYPSAYYDMYDMLCPAAIGKSTLVLTRATDASAAQLAPSAAAKAALISKLPEWTTPNVIGNHFKRMRYPFNAE